MDRSSHSRRTVVAVIGTAGVSGCLSGLTEQPSGSSPSESTLGTDDVVDRSIGVGEEATAARNVDISVSDLQAASTIETTASTLTPKAGHAFVLARITAARTGDKPGPLPSRDSFRIQAGGSRRPPVARIDDTASLREPVEGDLYRGSQGVAPGERRSGWVFFEIPMDRSAVTVVYEHSEIVSGEEVSTRLRWNGTVDVGALPNLAASVDVPDTITWGEQLEVAFTFENSGGKAGTIETAYVLDCPGQSTFQRTESITVDPQDSVTKRLQCRPKTYGNVSIRLGSENYTVPVVPPSRSYGETFEIVETASYAVSAPKTAESYEYRVYPGTQEGDPTKRFVFAQFTAEPLGDDAAPIPANEDFRLEVGDRSYEPIETEHPDDGEFEQPVSGQRYTNSFRTGERVQGWLVFEVPADAALENSSIEVAWGEQQGGPYRIRWVSG
jgi:hypothetical protein